MTPRTLIVTCLAFLVASIATATSFIVPPDEDIVRKADAIVIGTIEGSSVLEAGRMVETVYELRVERAIKGAARRDEVLRVVSPGGDAGDRGVIVPAAAHFRRGERVLLFLTMNGVGWTPTDLILGKFRSERSTRGDRFLVRDLDDEPAHGSTRGRLRREEAFVRFVEATARGARPEPDYMVDDAGVTLATQTATSQASATTFAGATYTSWVSGQPTRWPGASTGVSVWKRSDQNISGASDGGVSSIQNGLAAWTNECGSLINLKYAGQRATASANHDGVNVIEFNDPQSRVPGSWTGSGTIAITFISYAGSHSFGGRTWWNITDADIVFQNGFPATHGGYTTAMTHEIGHAIGWRHSNQHYEGSTTCNSSVEECTSAAIMNSSVGAYYAYALQPWDVNASRSVYPGGTCGSTCTAPAVTAQPRAVSITSGGSATLSVTASGTTPLSYQWYAGAAGVTSSPVSGATSASLTVRPSVSTSYWVRVSNACGAVNSAAATVTVSTSTTPSPSRARADFNGDGRSDIVWRNSGSGANAVWFMSGSSRLGTASLPSTTDLSWEIRSVADLNADGKPDLIWRNRSTGANQIWLMNGTSRTSTVSLQTLTDVRWNIVSVADFNGDAKPDIMWRHSTTGQNMLWIMNGTSMQSSATVMQFSDTRWQIAGSGDFNGDGKSDLVWRNTVSGVNAVWYMNGATRLGTASLPTVTDLGWEIVAVADMNNDARTDLIWRHRTSGADQIWFMSGVTRVSTSSFLTFSVSSWKIVGPK